MTLPEPLTPPDLDLRDFAYMPVDIGRLFGSEFHAAVSDTAWRAGVTLWLKSYHQVPGASVPDDDVALARLAEFGRDVKAWRKVRAAALHGWVKCSDGRLYHLVVAEKALEGWLEKLSQRKSSGAGNAKRWGSEFDPQSIDDSIVVAMDMLRAINPQSRSLSKRPVRHSRPHPIGTSSGHPETIPTHSQEKGRDIDDEVETRARGVGLISPEAFEITTALEQACGFALPEDIPPGWYGCAMWVQKCLNEGWVGEVMIEAAKGASRRVKGGFVQTFHYLEKPLAQAMAEFKAPLPQVEIRQPEKITVIANGRPSQGGNIIQAADRLLDKVRSFDAGPDEDNRVRDDSGAATTRLLSKG